MTGDAEPIRSILFVCYLNSIRSPMAEGLMVSLASEDIAIESCGLTTGELDELMVAVMKEKGIDMSGHVAQTLGDVGDKSFDIVIAFTEEAGEASAVHFADTDAKIEVWPTPDPTAGSLDVRSMMNNYRSVRDNIEGRLRRKFLSNS